MHVYNTVKSLLESASPSARQSYSILHTYKSVPLLLVIGTSSLVRLAMKVPMWFSVPRNATYMRAII